MAARLSACPDCQVPLQAIQLIDATALGWGSGGTQHVELSYATPDATPSFFMGKIVRLGIVKGLICPECGRIILYGEKAGVD